ncbi:NepR family anti-sigma factor [Microvirga pakistanensis]|uniref:NepR family anti-sigma factor n=1 Tax=Microvirga pakistanensis TaxID=1682650 RepID=UPI001FCE714E|nr:NepR family anti-sigma factor [Microvirga pakistanensis]
MDVENNPMQWNDNLGLMGLVPNSLTFSQQQVNFILGHSLRSVYQDTLDSPLPEPLKTLVAQLEAKFQS